jgi:hypothetical protein
MRVLGGVAVLAVGLLALPADLTSQALAVDLPSLAATAPDEAPRIVETQGVAGQELLDPVDAVQEDFIIEENQFGIRMFDPTIEEVAGVGTSAGVIAYPGAASPARGLEPVESTRQSLDSTPLPVAEGAELVESQFDGWQWVAVTHDSKRTLPEIESFYRASFDTAYQITRIESGDSISLRITLEGRMVGWVGIIDDGDVIRTRVVFTG